MVDGGVPAGPGGLIRRFLTEQAVAAARAALPVRRLRFLAAGLAGRPGAGKTARLLEGAVEGNAARA